MASTSLDLIKVHVFSVTAQRAKETDLYSSPAQVSLQVVTSSDEATIDSEDISR
jgi:hypothetical protein